MGSNYTINILGHILPTSGMNANTAAPLRQMLTGNDEQTNQLLVVEDGNNIPYYVFKNIAESISFIIMEVKSMSY